MKQVKGFFTDVMEIQEEVQIADAYRVGNKRTVDRPVMVKLKKPEDKLLIFKNASKSQGNMNARKKLYFVENNLDQEAAESRKVYRDLVKENKQDSDVQKLRIQLRGDKLIVNNTIVEKHIHSPTVQEILKITDEDKGRVMNAKLIPTKEYQEQNSDYYTYIQKVAVPSQVQDGLLKLCLKHGDATHVSCAYRLENATGPFNQEVHDNKEYGAGRTILNVIKKKGLKNICIYIVRYFGRNRLGRRRFKILEMLTDSAISTY